MKISIPQGNSLINYEVSRVKGRAWSFNLMDDYQQSFSMTYNGEQWENDAQYVPQVERQIIGDAILHAYGLDYSDF